MISARFRTPVLGCMSTPKTSDFCRQILAATHLPGRLDAGSAALLLGFNVADLQILVGSGLLKPLGDPRPNGAKYFASSVIVGLAADVKWLNKATSAVTDRWRRKNSRAAARAAHAGAAAGSEPAETTPGTQACPSARRRLRSIPPATLPGESQ
jgi:hypothetical protein